MSRPWQWDTDAITATVGAVRADRSLAQRTWPSGATAAVAISFDSDHETIPLRDGLTSPGKLSQGEYRARTALPRILRLLDRHEINASFYVPRAIGQMWREEFDQAYAAGSLFQLTMHPHVIGHRSRIVVLEELLDHIKGHQRIWFATPADVARYVAAEAGLTHGQP